MKLPKLETIGKGALAGVELIEIFKLIGGQKDLSKTIQEIKKMVQDNNLPGIKALVAKIDISTFVDENLYYDVLAELPPKVRGHVDAIMGKLAESDEIEKELHRNTIACIATNSDTARRKNMVQEIAKCNDVDKLKKLIYARGWDRPDVPVYNLAKKIAKTFKETVAPGIKKGFEVARTRIKIAAADLSQKTIEAFNKVDDDFKANGAVARAIAFRDKMKVKYYASLQKKIKKGA